MKKLTPLVFFVLASCGNPEPMEMSVTPEESIDSIISNSTKNIQISDTVQKTSNNEIVKDVQYLTKFVEILKNDKLRLNKELSISKMNVRIDTVFIEKKKNFWGKEKTTVNTKSDSISFDVIDSVDTDTANN
jgi:hypothetical protein